MIPLFLLLGASVPIAGAVYLNASTDYSDGAMGGSPTQSYVSANYTPVELNFNIFPSETPLAGSLFFAPRGTAVNQTGALIVDAYGNLIWDAEAYGQTMTFTPSTYQGQPVLALWGGSFNAGGWGDGYGLILDQTYTVIANISTTIVNQTNDFHEFRITTNDTALITVFAVEKYDLSSYNVTTTDGSTGWIIFGYAQEIDIATGEALFTWSSLDHVDPSLCYASPGSTGVSEADPWDYFHINSIDKDDSGNFLISSRHCHAIYYVSGVDGSIIWTMGGMNSSLTMGANTTYEWQHDARWRNNYTQISLFDNGGTSWEQDETESRGMLLDVDLTNMTATLAQEFLPWNATVSESQGSIEQQVNGNWLIGWGQIPFMGEYDNNGNLLWSAQFGVGDVQSYRVLRANWTGYPTTNPSVVVIKNATTFNYDIYVSWNGATEVSTWELLGSNNTSAEGISIYNATKTGFETTFSVAQDTITLSIFQIRALNSDGTTLGFSDFVSTNSTDLGAPSAAESSAASSITTPTFTSGSSQTSGSATTTLAATASTSTSVSSNAASTLITAPQFVSMISSLVVALFAWV